MSNNKVNYQIGENGQFIVRNYNLARPFSGFFPGIAGLYGKPMWVFFVNRAQGICSMGIENKDGAILEFQSANRAYTSVFTHGFRTFLRVQREGARHFYEPFTETAHYNKESLMSIGCSELYIEEKNYTLGLEISVRYSCIPGELFCAIIRELFIRNIWDNPVGIEILDGLPFIMPYGLTERLTKDMSHTIQAWMQVVNLDNKMPLFKLKVVVADIPVVKKVEEGHFYINWHFTTDGKMELIQPIVNPSIIFGSSMDLRVPHNFFHNETFNIPERQITEGITPSCFGHLRFELEGHRDKRIYAMAGNTDIKTLNNIGIKIADKDYLAKKREECRNNILGIQNNIYTESSSFHFNLYCKNSFLDNVLRGGYPVTVKDHDHPVVLHLFSRRHGDVERDYNKFQIKPTYYSQGDGNYRDVCQNRRNDIWFNPDVYEDNIKAFVNLIQLDGYNPLQIKGDYFIYSRVPEKLKPVADFVKKPFRLGDLLIHIEREKIDLELKEGELITFIASTAEKNIEAEYKEGYWVDHWTYIADLLDSYRSVYPDRYWNIFISDKDYTFYDSPAVVVPLKNKIRIKDGKIRQFGAVVSDEEKGNLIANRIEEPNKVRTKYGKGSIYKTTLMSKLLCLIANKYAALDPFGTGIMMEADRPGWYDALNGLPGLFGSSVCETFELRRLISMVIEVLEYTDISGIVLPAEISVFLTGLFKGINKKDAYRGKTKFGISGREKSLNMALLRNGLKKMMNRLDISIKKAYDPKTGLYHTYFINEVRYAKPLKFKQKALPLFLEGQVHALRLMPGTKRAKAIYNAVRKSGLYDEKLKMYKVNASLKDESLELGRVKVFSPGWLENESIWVHMEYKYMLELLRNDLLDEFIGEFKNVLIPFQNPEIFGRNILENCSFIVSSAHPDNSLHGVGFLPRLTGATAEFINIWLWMCIGKRPFFINSKNELNLKFQPVIPDWLFTDEGTFAFNMFGDIRVVYHNPQKKSTFGANSVKPFRIMFDDTTIDGDTIPAPYAEKVREKKVKRIDIYLG